MLAHPLARVAPPRRIDDEVIPEWLETQHLVDQKPDLDAVTLDDQRAHLVADMPFMSYQASLEQGVTNAGIIEDIFADGSRETLMVRLVYSA